MSLQDSHSSRTYFANFLHDQHEIRFRFCNFFNPKSARIIQISPLSMILSNLILELTLTGLEKQDSIILTSFHFLYCLVPHQRTLKSMA